MNDIRRTILWVVFGFSMVMLWDQWQVHNGRKATFFPSPAQQTASVAANIAVPPVASSTGVAVASGQTAAAGGQSNPGAPAVPKERFEVSTDVLKLTFDTQGGSLVRTEFLKYADMADKSRNFVLLDDRADRAYVAQTGILAGAQGGTFPTHKTVMKLVSGVPVLKEGDASLVIKFESPELGGVKLVKTYTVERGSYVMAVKHEVVNCSSAAISPQLYLRLVRDGNKPPGESSLY